MDAKTYESVVAGFAAKLAKSDKKSLVDLAAKALTAIAARDAEIDGLRQRLARYEAVEFPADLAAMDSARFAGIMAKFKDTFPDQVQAAVEASAYWTKKTGAQKAAKASHQHRPKQIAKKTAKVWWDKWQESPGLYPSKAEFARVMMDKFEELTNAAVIEKWCRDWEKEAGKRT